MIDALKQIFSKKPADENGDSDAGSDHDVKVAVFALCVEMARIDNNFTQAELNTLLSILKNKYNLSAAHADALIAEADKELEKSVDLWQFARAINDHYSIDEKIEIIEILWRIVFVDGKMDAHEHYLMNKLSNLLRLSHKQLIDAKLKVTRAE